MCLDLTDVGDEENVGSHQREATLRQRLHPQALRLWSHRPTVVGGWKQTWRGMLFQDRTIHHQLDRLVMFRLIRPADNPRPSVSRGV